MVLLLLGVLLLVGGLAWRRRFLQHRRAAIAAALFDPDPDVRSGALQAVAAVGLRPWADDLLNHISSLRSDRDPDRAIAAELGWLVSTCQWEPADLASIVQLRLWAKAQVAVAGNGAIDVNALAGDETVAGEDALRERLAIALGEPVRFARFTPLSRRSG